MALLSISVPALTPALTSVRSLAVPYDTHLSSTLPASTFAPHPPVRPRIIIQGITQQGRAFRPSDWSERLCGIMSAFGDDHQMRYSPYVRPIMLDGVRCVVVEPSLADIEPRAYRFLLDFAKDNELIVIDPTQADNDAFCPVPGSTLEKLASL